MDRLKEIGRKLFDEWELSLLGLLCIALAFLLLSVLLTGGNDRSGTGARGDLPIEPSRINKETAYALLEAPADAELPAPHAFASGLKSIFPKEPPPKEPPPEEPPPEEPPPEEPPPEEPPPDEPPPEEPPPEEPPQPQFHTYVYEGYRQDAAGNKVGILHNLTTDEQIPLRIGRQWRGYLVSKLHATEVVFLAPNGRQSTLEANHEIKIRIE